MTKTQYLVSLLSRRKTFSNFNIELYILGIGASPQVHPKAYSKSSSLQRDIWVNLRGRNIAKTWMMCFLEDLLQANELLPECLDAVEGLAGVHLQGGPEYLRNLWNKPGTRGRFRKELKNLMGELTDWQTDGLRIAYCVLSKTFENVQIFCYT